MVSITILLVILSITSSSFAQRPSLWQQARRPITSIKLAIANSKKSHTVAEANKLLYNPKIEKYEARLQSSPLRPVKDAFQVAETRAKQSFTSFGDKIKSTYQTGVGKMSNGLTKAGDSIKSTYQTGVGKMSNGLTKAGDSIKSTYKSVANNFNNRLAKAGQSIINSPIAYSIDAGRYAYRLKKQVQTWKKRKNEFETLSKKFESKPAITPSEKSLLIAMGDKTGFNDKLAFLEGKPMIPEKGLGISQILNNRKIETVNNKW